MSEAGIDAPTRENTVAYLQSWIKALKDDKTMLVKAANQAQKVADYIMGVSFAKDEPDANEAVITDDKVLSTA
jgi:antirestriction protein ArdC